MASGSSTAFGVIPGDGVSGAFYFQWPSVQNLGWYPEQAYKTWIDKTQPPFV